MPIVNPVPSFDFQVALIDAKPASSLGLTDLIGAGVLLAKSVLLGSFAEVSGLNAELEAEEYREGGFNSAPHQFIKWGRYQNLVLRRGISPNSDIWDWSYSIVYGTRNPVRKNGIIALTDRGGLASAAGAPPLPGVPSLDRPPIAIWFVRNALPQKIVGPSLNAKSNEIAIEALELVHEGLYRLGPAQVPGIGDALQAVGV